MKAHFVCITAALALLSNVALAQETKTPDDVVAKATFAGGCFWCMEPPFDALPGVKSTIAGYTGGHKKNPTYEEVSDGVTGHTEVVQVTYDPTVVSYEKLLDVYWRNVDPFDARGQFCDKGDQYRAEIFYHDEHQRRRAEASKAAVEKQLKRPVAVRLSGAVEFYPAEEYHQDYYLKNPTRYKFYRSRCGRDARLESVWGKPAK
jgi:peptide-methionine (S)-S-oxide reductase